MLEAACPGEMELARPRSDSHPQLVKEPLNNPCRPMELSVSLAWLLVRNPRFELTSTAIVDDEKPGRSPEKTVGSAVHMGGEPTTAESEERKGPLS